MEPRRALIVDDNPVNRELLAFVLEAEGFEVRSTDRPEQALQAVGQYHPDLLLVDVQLPGMSGLELTRRIRGLSHQTHPCIIIVTSYAMESDRERAFEAGCDGYITKPIDTRTFASEVLHIIGRRSGGLATAAGAH